jgi:hypothetical protein
MALPKLETPIYELELPSTGDTIKFRPFLVKEQKNLLIAMESEKPSEIKNCLVELIKTCTFQAVDATKIPMFDVEFLFLRIRGKSVGETVKLNILCPDDEKTRVDVTINLEDVGVQMKNEHSNEIKITDNIKVIMRYPTIVDIMSADNSKNNIESIYEMMHSCIDEIHEGDTIHHRSDVSKKEIVEFLDSLPSDIFEAMGEFFKTMPKVLHVIKVTNPKTKKKREVVIEGIESFFV